MSIKACTLIILGVFLNGHVPWIMKESFNGDSSVLILSLYSLHVVVPFLDVDTHLLVLILTQCLLVDAVETAAYTLSCVSVATITHHVTIWQSMSIASIDPDPISPF